MTFNLDDLVSTAERLTRRRRALVAVGAGTALVAAAAVAVPVVLGIAPGAPVELPMASSPTSSVTPPPKNPSVAYLTRRGEEMQAYLRTQLPQVIPGATDVKPGKFGGEAEGQVADDQRYLDSFVKYTGDHVPAAIFVQVQAAADPAQNCPDCPTLLQTDGSKVQIKEEDQQDGTKILTATHLRKDGTVTWVSTYNYDPTASGRSKSTNSMLTVDQLVRLAADPKLHF